MVMVDVYDSVAWGTSKWDAKLGRTTENGGMMKDEKVWTCMKEASRLAGWSGIGSTSL